MALFAKHAGGQLITLPPPVVPSPAAASDLAVTCTLHAAEKEQQRPQLTVSLVGLQANWTGPELVTIQLPEQGFSGQPAAITTLRAQGHGPTDMFDPASCTTTTVGMGGQVSIKLPPFSVVQLQTNGVCLTLPEPAGPEN